MTSTKPLTQSQESSQLNFKQLTQLVLTTLQADIDSLLATAKLPTPLHEACAYALMGNGKRVRPLLVASSYCTVLQAQNTIEKLQTEPYLNDMCRRAMLAVELLHTYSLIHDDLPCMDDDELRRGRATCHIAFDEATALLAGDVLQTLAFEILTMDIAGFAPITNNQAVAIFSIFNTRARRMVMGQMLDLNAENKMVSQPELEAIHKDKTGALIEASVLMGGICADANTQQLEALQNFASNLGLAFQVQDDILDVTASTIDLGKPAGSDEKLDKSTYVKLMGVEKATDYAKSLFNNATNSIMQSFGTGSSLNALADWLWLRQK